MTNKEFIEQIAPKVQAYCRQYGYAFPSAIIGQACLESGFGKSSLAYKYHNYFGMKCGTAWRGKSVNLSTNEEYTKGVYTTIKDNFRVYDSMDEGVQGYFSFINNSRYARLKLATSSRHYLEIIKDCGYATSSKYVDSVYSVITSNNLERFDNLSGIPEHTIEAVAKEVIRGYWGNGEDRKQRLTKAGYDYYRVQAAVNLMLKQK